MLEACLFNIQKFSLHDGPGIRTTVFFKGCPLDCAWCANPESIRREIEPLWNRERCAACGRCVEVCPRGALAMDAAGVAVARERCDGCGECVRVCPHEALSLSGRMYPLDEVVRECLGDREFYEESGGGVTLSGGEASMQAEFASALLRRLRAEGVHTAIETNGFASPAVFESVAAEADLLLFDVKHYDPDRHREGTGADNGMILANLRAALAKGRQVLVRVPVIRGYSDSLDDAANFAGLLRGLGVERVQLLPFHQLGRKKFEMLGWNYPLRDAAPLYREDLEAYRAAMLAEGMRDVIW